MGALGSAVVPVHRRGLNLMATATEYRRYRFAVKGALWLTSVAGAFFAGMVIEQQLDRPVLVGHTLAEVHSGKNIQYITMDVVRLRDGSKWQGVEPNGPLSIETTDVAMSALGSPAHLHIRRHANANTVKSKD